MQCRHPAVASSSYNASVTHKYIFTWVAIPNPIVPHASMQKKTTLANEATSLNLHRTREPDELRKISNPKRDENIRQGPERDGLIPTSPVGHSGLIAAYRRLSSATLKPKTWRTIQEKEQPAILQSAAIFLHVFRSTDRPTDRPPDPPLKLRRAHRLHRAHLLRQRERLLGLFRYKIHVHQENPALPRPASSSEEEIIISTTTGRSQKRQ